MAYTWALKWLLRTLGQCISHIDTWTFWNLRPAAICLRPEAGLLGTDFRSLCGRLEVQGFQMDKDIGPIKL